MHLRLRLRLRLRLAVIASACWVAMGIDLVALRGMSSYPPPTPLALPALSPDARVGRPLAYNTSFMPLCGNGRVDTAADYARYYATPPPTKTDWILTKGSLTSANPTSTTPTTVQMLVDERCDDGNRIDGDGCSADCMDYDAVVSPCEIAVDRPLVYEDMVFSSVNDTFVIATDGLYSLKPSQDGTGSVATLLLAKSFPATAVSLLYPTLYVFSAPANAIYTTPITPTGAYAWSLYHTVPSPEPLPSASFYTRAGALMLFCRGLRTLTNVDVTQKATRTTYTHPTDIPLRPLGENLAVYTDKLNIFCGTTVFTLSLATANASFQLVGSGGAGIGCTTGNATTQFWCKAKGYSLFYFTAVSYAPYRISYAMAPAFTQAETDTLIFKTSITPFSATTPMYYFTRPEAPRVLLDVSQPPGGTFLGSKAVFNQPPDPPCAANAWCSLDTPLSYNCLTRNSNLLMDPTATTYFSVLATAFASVPNLTNTTDVDLALGRYVDALYTYLEPQLARRLVFNAFTNSLWVVRSSSILEISKRGASVVRPDGRCVPAQVSLCPPCRWSPEGGACTQCPSTGSTIEWLTQCKTCATQARRRLLQQAPIPVAFTLGGAASTAEVAAQFPGAAVVGDSVAALTVTILTQDPQTTVMDINSAINAHPTWYVITAPRAVYSAPTPPPQTNTADTTSKPASYNWAIILGVSIPGAIILTALLCIYVNEAAAKMVKPPTTATLAYRLVRTEPDQPRV